MKLSNIFEQDTAQAAAMGANALKKTMGANTSGAMISKALGKLDQGTTISGPLAKALSPYADALEKILSNPMYRNKFMQMMKQIQTADKKDQAQAAPAVQEAEQLDEILPVLGAMAGRAAFAGAGAVTRGAASMAGRAVGSAAQSALDDNDEDPTDDASNGDEVDTVSMDVPLLLRVLEYAREDAQEDMDLHDVAERMIAMSKDGPLSMDDYDSIVGDVKSLPAPGEEPVEEGYYAPGPETMPGAVGPQETTTVSFNQSKQMGDATLNINASAKDMEELHRILKLAGIDYASDGTKQEPAVVSEPPAEEPCGCDDEPQDVKYSTDKQTLINVLRDKLQKRLA